MLWCMYVIVYIVYVSLLSYRQSRRLRMDFVTKSFKSWWKRILHESKASFPLTVTTSLHSLSYLLPSLPFHFLCTCFLIIYIECTPIQVTIAICITLYNHIHIIGSISKEHKRKDCVTGTLNERSNAMNYTSTATSTESDFLFTKPPTTINLLPGRTTAMDWHRLVFI